MALCERYSLIDFDILYFSNEVNGNARPKQFRGCYTAGCAAQPRGAARRKCERAHPADQEWGNACQFDGVTVH